MININMTIFIQMANFLIAYVIIRNILLRPAINELTKEEQDNIKTLSIIEQLNHANFAKKDALKNRWASCQLTLQNDAPKVVLAEKSMSIKEIDSSIKVPEPKPETVKTLAGQVAQQLTERLSHVQ
jgi:hypothetical protein